MSDAIREVAIVGGGAAGLTAGLYLCRSGIDAVLLDEEMTGGQAILSPLIENYPGFPEGIEGIDLLQRMKAQAERFGLDVKTFARVTAITVNDDMKKLTLESDAVAAASVIMATGRRPRKIGIPGEDEFTGRGISYCATCDAPLFRDKVVLVVGGGDAAIEEALHLARFAGKVIVVHRRGELRASSYLQGRAFEEPVLEFMWNSEVAAVEGGQVVERARILDNKTGKSREVPVDGVFFYVGNIPNSDAVADLVELDKSGYIVTGDNLETAAGGIFAAGDVRSNRFKQVVWAAAEGALAADSAQRYLESTGRRKAYEGGAST